LLEPSEVGLERANLALGLNDLACRCTGANRIDERSRARPHVDIEAADDLSAIRGHHQPAVADLGRFDLAPAAALTSSARSLRTTVTSSLIRAIAC